MMSMQKNAITIKKALLIFAIIIFVVACMAGCGADADTGDKTEGSAESSFRKQMADADAAEIEVKKDLVLETPVEVNGTKVLYGEGSITAVGDAWAGDEYMIVIPSGAQLTVKGSVSINADGITGGIHAAQGAQWSIQETASVNNASAEAANTLVEGVFQMNGGTLSGAMGHNVWNMGEVTLSEGEIIGSGTKCAGIYSEGTLTQNGGTIRQAYNNVAVLSGDFSFNGGSNLDCVHDGIYAAEGTKLSVTSKEAAITGSGVRGIYLCGEATVDGITLQSSGDSLMKISQSGVLYFNGGTLADSGYHSVENAGKMVMTGGSIRNSYNCGVVNTGTLEITGGSFLDNVKNKAVLNKHDGKATISSQSVMFSGNRIAVANEDTATLDLSKAEFLLSTTTNVYAYDGTVNIHDISLGASGSNNVRIYKAEVSMTNVQVLGNSKSGSSTTHGILLEGGVLNAKDVQVKNTTGYGIRNKGGQITAENLLISKSIKAGGISNMNQDHTGVPGVANIKNLTIEDIRYNNVVVEGGTLTITDGHLAASGTNNIKVTDGVLEMNNVDVLGNLPDMDGTNHAVYMTGGRIEAKDVSISNAKVSCLRINGETAVFNGDGVTIEKAPKYGIDQTIGQISINKLTMSGNYYNINNKEGTVKLTNSMLGPTKSNNLRSKGGLIDLRNVVINAHTADHVNSVHALFIDGGTLNGQNITAKNVSNAALRITGGSTNVRGLTVNDAGADGVWISGGKATIYDLTVKKAGVSGVAATKTGNITVIGGSIKNTVSHGAKSENDAKLTLKDVSVAIATTAGRHAVLAQGGDVHLEDVEITGHADNTTGFGIRINRDTSHVSGKGVHIADVNTGISASAGTADISGVTTANIPAHSVYASATANLVISDSEFGVTGTNNVKAENKGKITLNNTIIQGTLKNHGLIVENSGNIYGKNITVRDTAGCAIRVKCTADGSHVEIDGLVTENIGAQNVLINKDQDAGNVGSVVIKNGDLCRTGTHNVRAEAGNLTLIDTQIQGHTAGVADNIHTIYVSGKVEKTNLDGVTVLDAAGDALRIAAGDVVAEDFTSKQTGRNGIWVDGGSLKAQNTTISNSKNIGVYITGGAAVLDGANISGSTNNVMVTGTELTINGYADGSKSQIGTAPKDNVVVNTDAVLRLNNVDVQESKANNIVTTGGKTYVTDSTVTGGNYSILTQSAGYTELKNVTVTDPAKDGIRVNAADGKVVVDGVQIHNPVRYGVSAEKGTVELTGELAITSDSDQSSAIYVYNGGKATAADDAAVTISGTENGVCVESNATVALNNVTISDCAKTGVKMSSGTAVLKGINVSESSSNNINVSGGELTINGYADGSKSQVGTSKEDNIKSTGEGVIRLNDVNVLASNKNNVVAINGGTVHMKGSSVTGGNHSVLADKDGKVYLNDVTIHASANSGIRANHSGSVVEATDVRINGAKTGLSIQSGNVQITNITIRNTKEVGVSVIQANSEAKVTLNNLVTENCGTHAIYTSGASAALTVNGATLSNDGSDHVVNLNGGPMTLHDVAINPILPGQYELYSGAGWLTIGGEMDAEIYIATNPGRVIKVNKELTGDKLMVDWKNTPADPAMEFTTEAMMKASEDNIHLGVEQNLLRNYLSYYTKNGKGYAKLESDIVPAETVVTSEAELNDYLNKAAEQGLKDVTVMIGASFPVEKQVTIPAGITGLTITDDGKTETGNTITYSAATEGLFLMRSDLKLKLKDISLSATQAVLLKQTDGELVIENCALSATSQCVNMTGGTATLNGVDLSGSKSNIYVSGGELTVNGYTNGNKSQIGASAQDNVTASGTGVVWLNDVNVLASNKNNVVAINGGTIHMKDSSVAGGNHSVLADKDGKVYLDNVTIQNSANSGIRANHSGSVVEATDVTITGAKTGLSIKCGTVQITDITIRNTKDVGVSVAQSTSNANVTLNNLVTENCGTHAIYTSGAAAGLTVNGATLSNDGSDHVVNLNGGPMTLNDVTINGSNLAAGKYELYSGAGWLTIGGAMDANIYIAANNPSDATSGRVVKANKELTGNNLVIDWKNTPVGTAIEFSDAAMMEASKDNVELGSVQKVNNVFKFEGKVATLAPCTTVSSWSELSTKVSAQASGSKVTYRIAGSASNWAAGASMAIPAGAEVTLHADSTSPAIVAASGVSPFTLGENSVLTLENLTIGGTADAKAGHIIVPASATLSLNNTTLQHFSGSRGGAVHVNNGTLLATGATFTNNNSSDYGGAIGVWGGTVNVSGSLFSGNTSTLSGGAIMNYKADSNSFGGSKDNTVGTLTLSNCVFTNNTSNEHGGAVASWSGGTTTISGCVFGEENSTTKGNSATKNGGAVHVLDSHKMTITNSKFYANTTLTSANTFGGALYAKSSVQVQVSGCTFANNTSKYGGAINVENAGGISIEQSTFTANKADVTGGEGGAIRNSGSSTVANCTFDGNIATGNGGALIVYDSKLTEVRDTTFTGNSGAQGGAISVGTDHSLTLHNVVCKNNTTTGAYGGNTTNGYGDIRVADNRANGQVKISGKIVASFWNNQAHAIHVVGALAQDSDVTIDWRLGKLAANTVGIVFGSEEIMNASKAYIKLGVDASTTENWMLQYPTAEPWQAIFVKA